MTEFERALKSAAWRDWLRDELVRAAVRWTVAAALAVAIWTLWRLT